MKTNTNTEEILRNRVRLIEDGHWSLLGTPDDLIKELDQYVHQKTIEARIEAYKHGLMTGALPEGLGKPIAKDYLADLQASLNTEGNE